MVNHCRFGGGEAMLCVDTQCRASALAGKTNLGASAPFE
jgi:hypothetical protein